MAKMQQIPSVENQIRGSGPDPLVQWFTNNDGPWNPITTKIPENVQEERGQTRHTGLRNPMSYPGGYRQHNPSEVGSVQFGFPHSDSGYGTGPNRTCTKTDLSLSQNNNTIDRESLGEDLAWVEETLLLERDGKGGMAVVDSHVIDNNREGLREAWGIGPGGEIDGILEGTDVHHWDEVLGTSLFGMEEYLDAYNGTFVNEDTEIHEELIHSFLSSLVPPEDCNSGMSSGQGRYGEVVHNEEIPSQAYVDDNMSSKARIITTCISSFSG